MPILGTLSRLESAPKPKSVYGTGLVRLGSEPVSAMTLSRFRVGVAATLLESGPFLPTSSPYQPCQLSWQLLTKVTAALHPALVASLKAVAARHHLAIVAHPSVAAANPITQSQRSGPATTMPLILSSSLQSVIPQILPILLFSRNTSQIITGQNQPSMKIANGR